MIKKRVVEEDEREGGIRKILNFGHTLGHGIEAEGELEGLLHGECVALGMLPMCHPSVRERLASVLTKASLPTEYSGDIDKALSYTLHDKKSHSGKVDCILVPSIGRYEIRALTTNELAELSKVLA